MLTETESDFTASDEEYEGKEAVFLYCCMVYVLLNSLVHSHPVLLFPLFES